MDIIDPYRRSIFSKRVNICRTSRERFKSLEFLKEKNRQCMQRIKSRDYGMRPFQTVSQVAYKVAQKYCKKMGLPVEIKMLSLEMFERFMVCLLGETLKDRKLHPYDIFLRELEGIEAEFQSVFNTMPIYFMACIQVAAKFDNRDLLLPSPADLVEYLNKSASCKATELGLMVAEIKVISCMNYELNFVSRYEAVEDLIATRQNELFIEYSDEIFSNCVEILDMLLRNHRQIFDKVLLQLGVDSTKADRACSEELHQAEYDAVWIAGATIVVATRLTKLKNVEQAVFERLSQAILLELADDLCDVRTEHELRALSFVLFCSFTNIKM